MTIIQEKALFPSLLNIGKRYGMSKDFTGILLAFGNIIPEISVTILSFISHGIPLMEFGFTVNIAGATYCYTMVIGLAYVIAFGCKKTKDEGKHNKSMDSITEQLDQLAKDKIFISMVRDLSFFMVALFMYYIFLA